MAPRAIEVDRIVGDDIHSRGGILSARTKPNVLMHAATVNHGEVLVDGRPWRSPEVTAAVRTAAGSDARLVAAAGPERFDILPLLVATDGAIEAFEYDGRRLRPNIVVAGVEGPTERDWESRQLAAGEAVIALAELRGRCVMTYLGPGDQRPRCGRAAPHQQCFRRHPRLKRLGRLRGSRRNRRSRRAARRCDRRDRPPVVAATADCPRRG